MQPTRLILIEFNELCPGLLHQFMDHGWIPNFRRFFRKNVSRVSPPDSPRLPARQPQRLAEAVPSPPLP